MKQIIMILLISVIALSSCKQKEYKSFYATQVTVDRSNCSIYRYFEVLKIADTNKYGIYGNTKKYAAHASFSNFMSTTEETVLIDTVWYRELRR